MDSEKKRKNKLVSFFTTDIGYKIISIIGAIVVWCVIINIDDPIVDKRFNVEVTIVNADALSSVNKVYEIESGDVATIKVKGRKSIIDKLSVDDLTATADLSELSSVNAVSIKPSIIQKYVDDVGLSCNTVLKISLEEMMRTQLQVQVETTGTLEDGYALGECIAKPNMVEVTGGKSTIEKIYALKVIVDVNKVSKSFSTKEPIVCYDEAGNEIESDSLSFSNEKVKVKLNVFETKTIPVSVSVTGNAKTGYEYISASCLPESIQVYGSENALDEISEIEVPIDIDGMDSESAELEQNISIQDYLPSGVTVHSDYAMISVQIVIEKKIRQTFSVNAEKVSFTGIGDGLEAKMLTAGTSRIDITCEGVESIITDLNADDLDVVVDCTGLAEGRYEKSVKTNNVGVTVVNSSAVSFRLKSTASVTTETTETEDVTEETEEPTNPAETEATETAKPKETTAAETTETTEQSGEEKYETEVPVE